MLGNLGSESPSQCWDVRPFFPFSCTTKGSVGAETSGEAVKEESHQQDSTRSAAQSPGNCEHIPAV